LHEGDTITFLELVAFHIQVLPLPVKFHFPAFVASGCDVDSKVITVQTRSSLLGILLVFYLL
jgi:hypothetical protein